MDLSITHMVVTETRCGDCWKNISEWKMAVSL